MPLLKGYKVFVSEVQMNHETKELFLEIVYIKEYFLGFT